VRAQEVLPAMPPPTLSIEVPAVPPTTILTDSLVQDPPIASAIDAPDHSKVDSPCEHVTWASPPVRRRKWAAGAALMVVLAVAGGAWKTLVVDSGSSAGKSIAVMPFVNFSGDKEDEFFSEGITEDLVTQLAQISELKVISRTSILQYKDSKKPLREIARELGVAHILQGSVRRGDNTFRITAQLIDPAKEGHLWAKSYDRDMKDVLAVQSEVTREIAAALRAKLLAPEREQLARHAKGNPESHLLYRRGIFLIGVHRERTEADIRQAQKYFERIIETDPASPLGYAGLAAYHIRSIAWGYATPAEGYTRADGLVKKALAADAQSAEAHTISAYVQGPGNWDWKKAEASARRAIELNPGDADAWDILRATALEPTGRLDEAVTAQRRAVLLDPRNAAMAHRLAFLFIYQRRYDEALKQARANLELDPKYLNNYVVIARAHEAKGEFAQALAAYRIPQWAFLPEEAIAEVEAALAKSGTEGYWRARLAWQRRYAAQQPEGNYFAAAMAAQAGDIDDAFSELNRAIDARNLFLIYTKIDPLFDPLRGDARFAAALQRLSLN
jgi:TolB-like protein/Tfp pilus assembly protein PilF